MQGKKSYPTAKVAKKVKVAAKYKIARHATKEELAYANEALPKYRGVPYMRVEYVVGKKHEVVEFCKDGTVQGCEWEETSPHDCHSFSWFVAGVAFSTAIWVVTFLL